MTMWNTCHKNHKCHCPASLLTMSCKISGWKCYSIVLTTRLKTLESTKGASQFQINGGKKATPSIYSIGHSFACILSWANISISITAPD